jgi:hypothetical protein
MEVFFILILLALLGLILYAPIAIGVLRGRVRRLEDDLARLKARVEPAARERAAAPTPRATTPSAVEDLLATHRVAEPAAAPAPPAPVPAPAFAAAPPAPGAMTSAAPEPALAAKFAAAKSAPGRPPPVGGTAPGSRANSFDPRGPRP